MSDYKIESVSRAVGLPSATWPDFKAIVNGLEAEGWTPPPAPKRGLEVSDTVVMAYYNGPDCDDVYEEIRQSLAPAIRVWLKEALGRRWPNGNVLGAIEYRDLTGEEWPT